MIFGNGFRLDGDGAQQARWRPAVEGTPSVQSDAPLAENEFRSLRLADADGDGIGVAWQARIGVRDTIRVERFDHEGRSFLRLVAGASHGESFSRWMAYRDGIVPVLAFRPGEDGDWLFLNLDGEIAQLLLRGNDGAD